jgi:uncharacterized protein DUF4386
VATVLDVPAFDAPTFAPAEPSRKSLARRAGVFYLIACLPAPFSLVYVPGRLFVAGDPTATADRIRTSPGLLRLAMAAEIVSCLMLIVVAFALYRLFRDVDRRLAIATAVLIWIAIPIQLLNLANDGAALMLTSGAAYQSAFTKEQLDALAYLFYRVHAFGLQIAQVFWGLWLFPWGLVAMRSHFIPRWIGAAIIVAGTGYLMNSAVAIFIPRLTATVTPIGMAMGAGELAMVTWLLFWGARDVRSPAVAAAR